MLEVLIETRRQVEPRCNNPRTPTAIFLAFCRIVFDSDNLSIPVGCYLPLDSHAQIPARVPSQKHFKSFLPRLDMDLLLVHGTGSNPLQHDPPPFYPRRQPPLHLLRLSLLEHSPCYKVPRGANLPALHLGSLASALTSNPSLWARLYTKWPHRSTTHPLVGQGRTP